MFSGVDAPGVIAQPNMARRRRSITGSRAGRVRVWTVGGKGEKKQAVGRSSQHGTTSWSKTILSCINLPCGRPGMVDLICNP
jgi:hypothetical protein